MAETRSNLFRAVRNGTFSGELINDGAPVGGLLYPSFIDRDVRDSLGQVQKSRAEVAVEVGDKGPEVSAGGSISVHDQPGWFGNANWRYFQIPQGTAIPESLVITIAGDAKWNSAHSTMARRSQIETRTRMTLEAMMGALDNLARSAVVAQYRQARS
jgi:hypothetical protein